MSSSLGGRRLGLSISRLAPRQRFNPNTVFARRCLSLAFRCPSHRCNPPPDGGARLLSLTHDPCSVPPALPPGEDPGSKKAAKSSDVSSYRAQARAADWSGAPQEQLAKYRLDGGLGLW